MDFLKQLQWRYATKRMNGTKIPDEKLYNILEAIRLALIENRTINYLLKFKICL